MQSKLIGVLLMGAIVSLSACEEREVIFTGKRENIYSPDPEQVGEDAAAAFAKAEAERNTNKATPLKLPRQSTLGSWTQVGSNAQHNVPHVTFSSAPQVVFNVSIGKGETRKAKITAEPVVADGRVFTIDSENLVAAHTTGGEALWTTDITALRDKAGEVSGGGLAYSGGTLFATTGYGEIIAISAGSGQIKWRHSTGAAISGAPTVSGGTVYALNTQNRLVALNVSNGRETWQVPGSPAAPGVLGASAPAISGSTIVTPFSIGSVVGVSAKSGEPQWAVQVNGVRNGKAYAFLNDFTGQPVVSGSTIYVGTAAGASAAISTNGDLRWTSQEGAVSPMVVAGGSLFMIGDDLELVRLNASTGQRIWGVPLPGYTKKNPRRYLKVFPSYGPTLAGGRLWVASGDAMLRAFDPVSGALVSAVELPAPAASRPVIVGGIAYIVTEKGSLVALR